MDFVWVYPGELIPERYSLEGKTNPDLLEQEIVSGSGISWAICKSALWPRHITIPASHHSVFYRLDALPATQPTTSKHWRQLLLLILHVLVIKKVHNNCIKKTTLTYHWVKKMLHGSCKIKILLISIQINIQHDDINTDVRALSHLNDLASVCWRNKISLKCWHTWNCWCFFSILGIYIAYS